MPVMSTFIISHHTWILNESVYSYSCLYRMFIGTLWCGLGNIARNDSELGLYSEMDTCCRTHDRCEDYISSKAARYQLYNKYFCRR